MSYDVSRNGELLFSSREARLPQRTLVLVDREGRREPVSESRRAYGGAYFSPDGGRIAASVTTDVNARGAFVLDIASNAWTRVGARQTGPSWHGPRTGRVSSSYDGSSEFEIAVHSTSLKTERQNVRPSATASTR